MISATAAVRTARAGDSISIDQARYAVQIREAAAEFEKMLVRQMLREIRAGSLSPASGETQGYAELADDQLAASFAKAGGMGFGKAMAEQFLRQIGFAKSLR